MSRIATAISASGSIATITHPGVKGKIREILIKDLFRPLFPSDLGLGTGQIVTSRNEISSEQDVIVYNRRILPPIVYEGTLGIFPVESVLATIEIKSTLTMQEMRSTYEKAKVIQNYSYVSGDVDEGTGQALLHNVKKSISTVFALNSDLALDGKSEIERYFDLDRSGDPPIRAICVSGRGYWYFSTEWNFIPPDEEYQEILAFIVGLLDTFIRVGTSRRQPGLVSYLIDNKPNLPSSA
jgi:hypothetical protein